MQQISTSAASANIVIDAANIPIIVVRLLLLLLLGWLVWLNWIETVAVILVLVLVGVTIFSVRVQVKFFFYMHSCAIN